MVRQAVLGGKAPAIRSRLCDDAYVCRFEVNVNREGRSSDAAYLCWISGAVNREGHGSDSAYVDGFRRPVNRATARVSQAHVPRQ